MTLYTGPSAVQPGQEAAPWAGTPQRLPVSRENTGAPGHSYLQGHFLEVAPSPADDVAQHEDGAVGMMLLAVPTALQVGLVVSGQHIHPAQGKQGNPPWLPLSLPSQPAPGLQRVSPTLSVHTKLITL